jgi:hypothetical protein
VQVTAPIPEATARLSAVGSDMAKTLAVVTQRKTILRFIRFYHECDTVKASQSENFL